MKTLVKITAALAIVFGVYNANAVVPSLPVTPGDSDGEKHVVTISIPEVALLDLEGTTDITLKPTLPTEAGEAFDFSSAKNSNIWVNYSSVVEAGKSRNVTVEISSGTVPTGLTLKVIASADAGKGKGNVGSSAGSLTLTKTAQNLITGVKSCYTGNGSTNGHNLTYSLDLTSANNYADLANADTDLTITYTLTDDK